MEGGNNYHHCHMIAPNASEEYIRNQLGPNHNMGSSEHSTSYQYFRQKFLAYPYIYSILVLSFGVLSLQDFANNMVLFTTAPRRRFAMLQHWCIVYILRIPHYIPVNSGFNIFSISSQAPIRHGAINMYEMYICDFIQVMSFVFATC